MATGPVGAHFGTQTEKWGSGTEEEFRLAFAKWDETGSPRIMFYFSNAMSSLNQIDPEQLAKKNAFQEDIRSKGLYTFDYSSMANFQFTLMDHLNAEIAEVLATKEAGPDEQAVPSESENSLGNYRSLLAKDPVVLTMSLVSESVEQLRRHQEVQLGLNSDIKVLATVIDTATRELSGTLNSGKFYNVPRIQFDIYQALDRYRMSLIEAIPARDDFFRQAILLQLRVVQIVRALVPSQ